MLFAQCQKRQVYIFIQHPNTNRDIIWESLKSSRNHVTVNEARLEMKVPTVDGGTSTIYVAGWENREF